MKLIKNKKGFTLVELLAVLVILALLALLAGSAIMGSINKAEEQVTKAQEKAILNAAEKWSIDNSDKFDDIEGNTIQVGLDVVFVLDMSGSMTKTDIVSSTGYSISRNQAMVEATNSAMNELMTLNNNTRIGITLYGSSGIVFLPLNTYTSSNGSFVTYSSSKISTSSTLMVNGKTMSKKTQSLSGCTYTQAGIASGASQLMNADNKQNRIPVIIMLSDGAPSIGASDYDNVLKYNSRSGSDLGTCQTAGDENSSFGTIRSAMYYKNAVKESYGGSAVFFYTIGFGLDAGSYEEAVLNPTKANMENLSSKSSIAGSLYKKWKDDGKKNYSYADGAYIGKMDASTLKNLFINISNEVVEATKITQVCVTVKDLYDGGYLSTEDIEMADGEASSTYVLMNFNEATNQYNFSLAKNKQQEDDCKKLLEAQE